VGTDLDSPLEGFREVSGRRGFVSLGSLHDAEPLKEPLRRWVLRLTCERVNAEALRQRAALLHNPVEIADIPEPTSRRELLQRALSERGARSFWLTQMAKQSEPLQRAESLLWQREREITALLGVAEPSELASALRPAPRTATTTSGLVLPDAVPTAPAEPEEIPARQALQSLALRCLSRLGPRLAERKLHQLDRWIDAALAQDVRGDFPSRIDGPRLLTFFSDGDLFRALDLPQVRFPRALGASSFIRSLDIAGGAWQTALEPRNQPFCISVDPYHLPRHQSGAMLASLSLNEPFLSRKMSTDRAGARELQRQLAWVWLQALCWRAIKVLLRPLAQESTDRYTGGVSDWCGERLALDVPRTMAGALLPLDAEDESRFLGSCLGYAESAALIESHDEDWFRHPRAIEQLRAEHQRPSQTRCTPPQVERAIDLLCRKLEAALG
jgi:hypothetical protein